MTKTTLTTVKPAGKIDWTEAERDIEFIHECLCCDHPVETFETTCEECDREYGKSSTRYGTSRRVYPVTVEADTTARSSPKSLAL